MNWRARFFSSTRSKSRSVTRPTPRPARFCNTLEPSPPAPRRTTCDRNNRSWSLLARTVERGECVEECQVAEVAFALVVAERRSGSGVLQPAKPVELLQRVVDLLLGHLWPSLGEDLAQLKAAVRVPSWSSRSRASACPVGSASSTGSRIEAHKQGAVAGEAVQGLEAGSHDWAPMDGFLRMYTWMSEQPVSRPRGMVAC